jgi:DNA-binding NtrC family response regulator
MLRPRRILVVDDDPAIATLLAEILTDEGYTVRLAYNGPGALSVIAAQVPDLVLIDLLMPGMSGLELLHAVRARGHADLPVILVTAAADRAVDLAVHTAAAFLPKPFDLDELLSCVEQSLRLEVEQREVLA